MNTNSSVSIPTSVSVPGTVLDGLSRDIAVNNLSTAVTLLNHVLSAFFESDNPDLTDLALNYRTISTLISVSVDYVRNAQSFLSDDGELIKTTEM